MLEYFFFVMPACLIARPKAYLRSLFAYFVGVALSYGMTLTGITVARLPYGEIENHIGQMILLPAVGVVIAWFAKEPQVNTALDVSSMRVRFGMFVGWLFNAVACVPAALVALIVINQSGTLSQVQTTDVVALLGVNRLATLTPYRRPILTPSRGVV